MGVRRTRGRGVHALLLLERHLHPATNEASGEVTFTLTSFDGSVVSPGTGTWSATYDPETGVMTGTVVIDDQVLEFSASAAG